ncbi:MAG: hypothetical protein ACQEXX_26290 [Bacillota bacterium]
MTGQNGKYQVFAYKGFYQITPVNDAYSVESRSVEIGDVTRVQANFTMKKYVDLTLSLPLDITAETPFDISVTVLT